jgi:hypothetical protein
LFKEHTIVEGRKPTNSLYDEKLAAYTSNDEFNQSVSYKLWERAETHTTVNQKETVKNDMNNLGKPPNLLELKVNLQFAGLLIELAIGR